MIARMGMLLWAVAFAAGCRAATPMPQSASDAALAAPHKRVPIEPIAAMSVAVDRAIEMARRHGPEHVLAVFDLDSTLLRDPGRSADLDALEKADPARFRQIERTIMYLKPLVPTERGLRDQLARLERAGIATYLLTARGPDMRDMTVRELEANDLRFPLAPECGPPLCVTRGTISAEQVHAAAAKVLGLAELGRVGFDRGRRITVWDGIVMAAGLDKGVILRTLGASLGRDIRGYVFVDDADKNVANVARAAETMPEEISVYRYASPERGEMRGGTPRTRAEANAAWDKAAASICMAFAPRWCETPAR